jgi:quinoprotein glucose dehydrogenase
VVGVFAILAFAGVARGAQQGGQPSAPASPAPNGSQPRSVWDGVYTDEQARRGKDLYTTHCLSCHGDTLEGSGPVRPLTGPDFAANWNGLSMGDMLERTRTTMPMDKPGTLSRQQIADVLSYVLSVNKMPAGDTELPRQSELLSPIKFLAQKPSGDRPPAPSRE